MKTAEEPNVGDGVKAKLGRRTNMCLLVALSRKQCVQRSAACHPGCMALYWWQDLPFPAGLGAGKSGT